MAFKIFGADCSLLRILATLLAGGVVRGDQLPSAMQYCFTDHLIRVFGDPGTDKARVGPGSWAAFKFLQYGQIAAQEEKR
jgi:hypothetical protein